MRNETNQQFTLPKNIRQIGTFGETYKIYVEDFVYTYVHQFVHRRKREGAIVAAVLLGKTYTTENQEYVFISGAQKVDFREAEDTDAENNSEEVAEEQSTQSSSVTDVLTRRQQEFWNGVYQGIKEYFDEQDILGWYFNIDGGNLQIDPDLQQFFESTYKKGSRFLYLEDTVEKNDAFFVQEQHRLQRISGYAVYYEKNPAMQEYMIAEKEKNTPRPLREKYIAENNADDVAQNYRAIMNKLNEKPPKRRGRPAIYVAGVAVLAVVAATGITQIGNYQNLKLLEQTMQTLSGTVNREHEKESSNAEEAEMKTVNPDVQTAETGSKEPESTDDTSTQEAAVPGALENTGASGAVEGRDASAAEESSVEQESLVSSGDSDTQSIMKNSDLEESSTDSVSAEEVSADDLKETVPVSAIPDYYVVKKGDSLVSISKSLYNTTDMIDDICELNKIENVDIIYEGQKLLLPK